MIFKSWSTADSKTLWLTAAIFLVMTAAFGVYLHAHRLVDRAHDSQNLSLALADQLRHSSDDLTRMVRTYVVTGDPIYKKRYQTILDIRDGRKPQPKGYQYVYWDLLLADAEPPQDEGEQAIALLDQMRQAGFAEDELRKLATAKVNSDGLTVIEFEAMRLAESIDPNAAATRAKANLMLNAANYHRAKAAIMQPINEAYELMSQRTARGVRTAERDAKVVLIVFIVSVLGALIILWRAYVTVVSDFAGRKRAENVLKASEAKYRALVETTGTGYLILDTEGKVVDANLEYVRQTGRGELQDILGKPVTDWTASYEKEKNSMAIAQCARDGFIRDLVIDYVDRSGRITPIEINATAVRDGDSLRIISLCRDITERGQAQRKLLESEIKLSTILESVDAYIYLKDTQGRYLFANRSVRELFGASLEQVVGQTDEIFIDAQTAAQARNTDRQVLVEGKTIKAEETRVNLKDGRASVYLSVKLPLRNEVGAIYALCGISTDITERKRAEEALGESEGRLRLLFDGAIDGILILTASGDLLSVNESFARMHGYSADEMRNMTLRDLDTPDNSRLMPERMRRLLAGEPLTFEVEHYHKDGYVFPLEVSASLISSDDKQLIQAFHRDITERKRTETLSRTRLRLAELAQTGTLDELLQTALDGAEEVTGSKIGFFHFVDADQENLTLQAWSTNTVKNMCTAEGKGQHHAISAAGVWVDAVRARTPVIHNDYASLAHKKGMPEGHAQVTRELVVPIIRAGKLTEIMGVGNKATDYVQNDVEAVELVATMVRDIVDRRRAEDALRNERALLQQITASSPVGIAVVHRAGRITLANEAAEKILGLKKDEITQRDYNQPLWKHTDLAGNPFPLDQLPVARVLATGESVFDVEHGIEWPDGRRVLLSVNAAPLFDASGNLDGAVATILDITERKHLEEVHLQAQKLESLGTLAGGIAHDFNNILTAIKGNADLAVADAGPNSPVAESLEEIKKASERAAELVRRITTFARSKDTRHDAVDLRAVVAEVLKLLRSTLPAAIILRSKFDEDTPYWVLADAGQIHEAVVNLTTNAAHAIGPHPGTIEYRIEVLGIGQEQLARIPGLDQGRYVCLTVTDSGCGMEADTLTHIFDAFYTTKPIGEGTGLGLSMVHGTMKGHGGAVTVESVPGSGSSFRLYFRAAKEAESKAAKPAAVEETPVRGRRVLYVDDELALVSLARRVFSRLGHSISSFTDPRQALEAFRAAPHEFDLVVTDLSMPYMSGFEFASEVLGVRPGMPVLLMTGRVGADDENNACAIGIHEVLLKPVSVDELSRVLDRIFRSTEPNGKPSA